MYLAFWKKKINKRQNLPEKKSVKWEKKLKFLFIFEFEIVF